MSTPPTQPLRDDGPSRVTPSMVAQRGATEHSDITAQLYSRPVTITVTREHGGRFVCRAESGKFQGQPPVSASDYGWSFADAIERTLRTLAQKSIGIR